MRVVIYVRVSTQEQAKEGYSVGEQVERLKKYCEAMGWEIVEIYLDPGYSGGSLDRPGLQKMIRDIKAGEVDKVVVYKLDRLSRSQKDTLFLIEDVFLKNNTDFVSMNENFDTSTPFGRAMIGILAVFAQLEREQIKERMAMGKDARAKEGKWNGGQHTPIGYEYNSETGALYSNEYEQMQVRELRTLFMQNVPLRAIATLFAEKGYGYKGGTKWEPTAMRRVLRSKAYLGYNKRCGEWFKGTHDPIFTQEEYDEHVALLDERAEAFAKSGIRAGVVTTYLGGLLFCKHCGGKYAKTDWGRNKDKTTYAYRCYSRSKKMKSMIKDPNCKNKNWKAEELEAIVFDAIRQLALDPSRIMDADTSAPNQDENANQVALIEKEIEKLDAQISRFLDLYGMGRFTAEQLNSKTDPLNATKAKLVRELNALNAEAGRVTAEEAVEYAASLDEALEHGTFEEVRGIIEALIYTIELDGDDAHIHWKLAK